MAIEFSNSDAPLTDFGVKILAYGPTGTGKTMLVATLPGPVAMIGCERGHLSLTRKNQMRVFGQYRHIEFLQISNVYELKQAYDMIAAPKAPFVSIALDSLTEIAEKILTEQKFLNKDPRKAYGEMQDIMSKYIRLFRDLPNKHVYMTAQMEKTQDASGLVLFGPSMPGKTMTEGTPYFFDEVFSLFVSPKDANGKDWRVIRTRPDNQFSAKDRSGALAELEPPDLTAIINKIREQ